MAYSIASPDGPDDITPHVRTQDRGARPWSGRRIVAPVT